MDYEETASTTVEYFKDILMDANNMMNWDFVVDDAEGTTTTLPTTDSESIVATSRVLGLYDIFIPLLGVFIIALNLAVVVSSGLILKKGKCGGIFLHFQHRALVLRARDAVCRA